MKKISVIIFSAIFCCVAVGVVVMEMMLLTLSGNELTKEAERHVQHISNENANSMNAGLTKYETIIKGLQYYVSSMYDIDKLDDSQYTKSFQEGMKEYIPQFVLKDPSILGVYLYMNPDEMKELYGVWYTDGELVEEDPVEEYELYLSDTEDYDFYRDTVAQGGPAWMDPYYDELISKNCMSYTTPIYIDNKLCAVVGLDIEFTDFEAMVKEVKLFDTGHAFLVNEAGNFITGLDYTIEDSMESVGYTKLSAAVQKNPRGIVQQEISGENHYVAFAKLDNGFTFVVAAKEDEVLAGLRTVRLYSIIIGIIIVLGTAVVSLMIGKSISKPIIKTAGDLSLMQDRNFTGKGHQQYVRKRNEIGVLAKAMEDIQSAMGTTVHTIGNSSDSVHQISDKINTLSLTLTDEVTSISGVSEQLAASMEQTAATADELSAASDKMSDYVDNMTNKNDECMSEVMEIGIRAVGLKKEALSSSKTAEQMTKLTSEKMRTAIEKSQQVAKIQELSETILSISSETSLLALNASIEAARAGEFGRGFAVVAQEISQLAVGSEKSAQEIQEITNQVIGTVHELSETAGEMLEFAETNLKETYEKLLNTSEQYSTDTEHITDVLSVLSKGMANLSHEIKNVAQVFQDLKQATNDGAEGTTDIARNVETISADIMVLQQSANELGSVSQELVQLLHEFII